MSWYIDLINVIWGKVGQNIYFGGFYTTIWLKSMIFNYKTLDKFILLVVFNTIQKANDLMLKWPDQVIPTSGHLLKTVLTPIK